jgi:hypothetical protein
MAADTMGHRGLAAIGFTGRNASWARRILRFEREVRRLGACMAINFQWLK